MPDKQEEVPVFLVPLEGEEDAFTDPDVDLPPGRLHATRVPERLQGAPQKSPHPPVRRKSLTDRAAFSRGDSTKSNLRSRSRSPSLKDTCSDSMSSLSLEDVDSDILTDKLGLSELDREKSHSQAQALSQSSGNLATLNERMSEETLDDVHAFSDARPALSSRGNSTVGTAGDVGNSLLETLDEACEEDELDETTPTKIGETVMVLNLENLTIHEQEENEDDVSLEPVCGASQGESTV
jgi:hypothetical protein